MQRIIVLGATSGIGRALAAAYAESGERVGIAGRREPLLQEIQAEHPDRYETLVCDITDIARLEEGLSELTERLGGLDMLILSSGTGELNTELDFAVELPTLNTNVLGFTAAVDWAYRYFERQGRGHLVAITSLAALVGGADAPAYNASKAFQANYLSGLRGRAAKSGNKIFITDIRPGFVDTAMAKGEGLFWVAPIDKAVRQMLAAIRRRRRVVYVTKRWGMVAFLLRLFQLL